MSKKLTNTIRDHASNKEDHNIVVNATIPGSCCCCDDPETDILFELYALLATLPKRGPRIISKYIDCRIDVVNVFDPFWIEVVVNVEPQEFHKDILVGELMQRLLRAWPAYIPIKVRIEPIFFYGPLFLGQIKLRGYLNNPVLRGSFIASPTEYYGPLFLGQIKLRGYLDKSILQGKFTASPSEFFGPLFLGQIKLRGNFYEGILAGKFSATPAQFYGPLFLGQIKLRGYFDRVVLRGSFYYGGGTGPTIHFFSTQAGSIQYAFSSVGGGPSIDTDTGLASTICLPYGQQAIADDIVYFDRNPGNAWILTSGGAASEYNWWNDGNIGMFMITSPYMRSNGGSGDLANNDQVYIAFQGIISFDLSDPSIYPYSINDSTTTGHYTFPIIFPIAPYNYSDKHSASVDINAYTFFDKNDSGAVDLIYKSSTVANDYWKAIHNNMGNATYSGIRSDSYGDYLGTKTALQYNSAAKLWYLTVTIDIRETNRRRREGEIGNRFNIYYNTRYLYLSKVGNVSSGQIARNICIANALGSSYNPGLTSEGYNQWQAMVIHAQGDLLGRDNNWAGIKSSIISLIHTLNP